MPFVADDTTAYLELTGVQYPDSSRRSGGAGGAEGIEVQVPLTDLSVIASEEDGVLGVHATSDDITQSMTFTSIALVVRFLALNDTRGATTWTLTDSSHIGVVMQYNTDNEAAAPDDAELRSFFSLLDLEPPIFTSCPGDVVVAANDTLAVGVAAWPDPVATDNREVAEVVSTNAWANRTYPLLPPGAAPVAVVYEARDLFDNVGTCSFTVTVVDNQPPVVPAPFTVTKTLPPDAARVAVAESEWRPTGVTDNAQQQHAGGGGGGWAEPRLAWDNATASYAFGTHVVGMVFEDAYGNNVSTHTTIVVEDVTPPSLVCPSSIERLADAGATSVAVSWTLIAPTDNSNLAVATSVNRTSGDAFAVGTHAVGVTATDVAGNAATCAFTVTVVAQGTQPPGGNGTTQDPQVVDTSASGTGIIIGSGAGGGVLLLVIIVAVILAVQARKRQRAPQDWEKIFELMKSIEGAEEGFK